MKNFSIEEINNRFNSLSPELQNIITSPAVKESLELIAQKNGLKIDELGIMVDLVGLIILGLMSPTDFVEEFSSETGITEKSARVLVADLNSELFAKMRTSMRESEEKYKAPPTIINNQPPIEKNPYRESVFVKPAPVVESFHTDLEKAGDFKIETEAGVDSNISLKSPMRKPAFVTEQKAEMVVPKVADTAVVSSPKVEPVREQIEIAETKSEQHVESAIQPTSFDPKSFYNFGNIEEEQVAPDIHHEKEVESKYSKIATSQSHSKVIREVIADKKAENIIKKEEVREIPKQKEIEKLATETIKPNVPIKEDADPKEIKREKENISLIDEMIAHPKAIPVEKVPEKVVEKVDSVVQNTVAQKDFAPVNLPIEQPVINIPVKQPVITALTEKPSTDLPIKQPEMSVSPEKPPADLTTEKLVAEQTPEKPIANLIPVRKIEVEKVAEAEKTSKVEPEKVVEVKKEEEIENKPLVNLIPIRKIETEKVAETIPSAEAEIKPEIQSEIKSEAQAEIETPFVVQKEILVEQPEPAPAPFISIPTSPISIPVISTPTSAPATPAPISTPKAPTIEQPTTKPVRFDPYREPVV